MALGLGGARVGPVARLVLGEESVKVSLQLVPVARAAVTEPKYMGKSYLETLEAADATTQAATATQTAEAAAATTRATRTLKASITTKLKAAARATAAAANLDATGKYGNFLEANNSRINPCAPDE